MSQRYYRLEYNEKQGFFHFKKVSKPNLYTFGWAEISPCLKYEHCSAFAEWAIKKYPNINSGNGKKYPSVSLIKQEFENFKP